MSKNPDAWTLSPEGKGQHFGKTHAGYWKPRLFRSSYTHEGERSEGSHWCIKIAHKGIRETINLRTPNQATAAQRAADAYKLLMGDEGWQAVRAKWKPKPVNTPKIATVGEFLAAMARLSEVSKRTLGDYSRSFRHIVAGVMGIEGDKSRFDYVNGGSAKWRERVDAVKLAAVTPAKVQAWKLAFVARGAGNHQAEPTGKVSVNSLMRQAKSLFSDKRGVLTMIREELQLPSPLLFDGVGFYESQSMRYQSKIDAGELLTAARDELAQTQPEAFKALVLALCCGLRRNEIDKLTWRQVDFSKGVLRIETIRYFSAKSEDSLAEVDLDTEIVALMRGWKAKGVGEFVIHSENKPRTGKSYAHYRTGRVMQALADWLRAHGVDERKYLHTLRKEFGSLVAQEHGIYAASRALRHADIQVTAKHYLDKKQRISIGLGRLLAPANVIEFKEAPAKTASKKGKRRA